MNDIRCVAFKPIVNDSAKIWVIDPAGVLVGHFRPALAALFEMLVMPMRGAQTACADSAVMTSHTHTRRGTILLPSGARVDRRQTARAVCSRAPERRSATKSPHFLISVNRLSHVRAVIELPSRRLR
ncbi:hypothetical protein EIB72_23000 [Burkholderia ambifaria]|uniref:hypothetical protein n=1 Tax=Burkholderia ambifaria TaxID=152480 RepID=UPI0013FD2D33|nr:hypothetical protein [Burkholderia ambifaria]NHL69248.1 hypothetical protein [Burkholderia ambifaria]